MIRGGTAGSNIGKGFSVTNRIRKMYLGKPVNRMTPQEARVTLKLIDDVIDKDRNEENRFKNKALMLVGFSGGFRRSELVAIDYEDLDFVPEGV